MQAARRHILQTAGILALAAALAPACTSNARAPLEHTLDSAEGAARAVLDGIAARDGSALLALALDEHEFRQVVWPELPSSRPEVGLPAEYAWSRLAQNSRSQLALTLAEHGGRRYEYVSLRFRGESSAHQTFTVHREAEVTVRDGAGRLQDLRLFGSLLERDGRWKVFSFVVD